ncbi:MAG: DUF5693 family protein [Dethiobacteria bacterium]
MNTVLLFFLLLAVVTACYAGSAYHLPAGDSRAVELTVRYSDVQIFAARAGLTVEEALLFLKERGVTSVGVAEYTLWQLRKEPGFYVLSSLELAGELALNPELSPYRDFLETKAREAGFSFGDYLVFMPDRPLGGAGGGAPAHPLCSGGGGSFPPDDAPPGGDGSLPSPGGEL